MWNKYRIAFAAVLLLALLLSGCRNSTETTGTFCDSVGSYAVLEASDSEYHIYEGSVMVGGIVLSDLNNGSIEDIDQDAFIRYLDGWVKPPLSYEYISMYASDSLGDFVSVKLKVTDTNTEGTRIQHRYLFEKDTKCVDLWLEDELVEETAQKEILDGVRSAA